jgi:hypothetical protein
MPTSLLEVAEEGRHSDKKEHDVFALVKEYMADDSLAQEPLKVLPECLRGSATSSLLEASTATGQNHH